MISSGSPGSSTPSNNGRRTDQDWNDVEQKLVDYGRGERLADGGGAADDVDAKPVAGCSRALERGVEPFGYQVERRPAVHLDWLVRIVSENEHRRVISRLVSPPSPPLALPGPADRAEHVTAGRRGVPARSAGYAAAPDVAGGGVDRIGLAGCGPVPQAV